MLLSVIIPVYRVEHTLSRCIESVLGQCESMEIILVDDGSPDGSPALCDEWANKDAHIVVVHKENGGLSDARNAGINIAKGDYLAFVDSDDTLAPFTLRDALECAKENACDIVEFPVLVGIGSSREYRLSFSDTVCELRSPEDARRYWLENSLCQHSYAWNKLYSRGLFDDVRFPVGQSYEDLWTLPELLFRAKKIATISKGSYHYFYNDEGICRSGKYEAMRLDSLIHAYKVLGIDVNDSKASGMLVDMLNCQITSFAYEGKINKEMIDILHHLPVSFGRNVKEKFKILLLHCFGLKNLCRLMTLS